MTKDQIIKTAVYFADQWKVGGRKIIYGDLPNRYDKAEHLANEMLNWPNHKAWDYINKHFNLLLSCTTNH